MQKFRTFLRTSLELRTLGNEFQLSFTCTTCFPFYFIWQLRKVKEDLKTGMRSPTGGVARKGSTGLDGTRLSSCGPPAADL